MAISDELTRIQTAKADIKASIEAKGVTVPSSALIDEYADYVDEISGGGGGQAEEDLKNLIERDITSITIPSGTTSIGVSAFYGCSGLTSVTIPNSVTLIDEFAFAYIYNTFNITIPNSVTTINYGAFKESRITNIIIPNSVTVMGDYVFDQCTSLTSVTIGGGVTSIGQNAFYKCNSLTSITIPNGVTSIGTNAFRECTSLTSITVEATTPPTLANVSAFSSTNNCPIYVPAESVAAYQAANRWSTYASRIQAIPSNEPNVSVQVTVNQSQAAKIFGEGSPVTYCDYIKVDGTEISLSTLYTNNNYYTFTTGQHTILYKAKNPSNVDLGQFAIVDFDTTTMTVDSFVASEGFGGFTAHDYPFKATNVDLPSTIVGIETGDTSFAPIECTNLTIRNTSSIPYLSSYCDDCETMGGVIDPSDDVCKECNEWDEETGDCIDFGAEITLECNDILPTYTDLYVPTSMVTNYQNSGWNDVNAIQ